MRTIILACFIPSLVTVCVYDLLFDPVYTLESLAMYLFAFGCGALSMRIALIFLRKE